MPDENSPEAEEGTMLHSCVAKNTIQGLDGEQSDMVLSCRAFLEARIAATKFDTATMENPVEIHREDGRLLTKGTCDVLLTGKSGECEVIDWKFGRIKVAEAARNLQLAAYALGAIQLIGAKSCTVHVFQPRIGYHSQYTFSRPTAILANIERVVMRSTSGPLILNPGESQCRYCKAKGVCPAFRRQCDSLAIAQDRERLLADPATLADYYGKAKVVKAYCVAIEKAMKTYLDQHGECAGYRYREVQGDRECTDKAGLHVALDNVISPSEFLDCCSVSVSSLENMFVEKLCAAAEASGGKITKTAAKEKFAEMCDNFIGRGKPSYRIEKDMQQEA